jgi:hypothetical protein
MRWAGIVIRTEDIRGEYRHWFRDVSERGYLKYYNVQEVGWGGMDWIDLAHDRDRWRAFVDWVMNFRVL